MYVSMEVRYYTVITILVLIAILVIAIAFVASRPKLSVIMANKGKRGIK